MNQNLRRMALIIGSIVIIGGGIVAFGYLGSDPVPAKFREARERGAFISERIVENSASLANELGRVSQLEKEKKFTEASALVDELTKKNDEIKTDALELADKLEEMTKAVPEINNPEARSAALEAVNNELAVITHLLKYSDAVNNLFENLQDRFKRNRAVQLAGWIEEVNVQVGLINEYNSKAKQAFEKFDSLVK